MCSLRCVLPPGYYYDEATKRYYKCSSSKGADSSGAARLSSQNNHRKKDAVQLPSLRKSRVKIAHQARLYEELATGSCQDGMNARSRLRK